MNQFCFIIPVYNHGKPLADMMKKLMTYQLPVIISNDGSNQATLQILKDIEQQYPQVSLIHNSVNEGKGAAFYYGLQQANQSGLTHAIQIDADNQHDTNDIPQLIECSQHHPEAIISGMPIYDHSAPKSRLYGRKITNFWVAIETWSLQLKESMCGFRVYPIKQTLAIIDRYHVAKHMAFDIEILVRWYWHKPDIVYIPTKVIYPEDGLSHFKIVLDNLRISWAHTRLFFGMLRRMPRLFNRKLSRKRKPQTKHWSNIKESGTLMAMRLTLSIYKLLGKTVTGFLLYPIIAYFYFSHRQARMASKQYLNKIQSITQQRYISFKHFLTFGQSALDKLSVWSGHIDYQSIVFENRHLFLDNIQHRQGGVILTAHLGNFEVARALSSLNQQIRINVIVFSQHAQKFNQMLKKVNPKFHVNLIETTSIDLTLAMQLKDKVDQGEFIIIASDRTSTQGSGRASAANFLGDQAYFPQGPFILAALLQTPVYFMLCLKENKYKHRIIFDNFAEKITLPRRNRADALQTYIQQYAGLLETYCMRYPYQWFNFFDFWQSTNDRQTS